MDKSLIMILAIIQARDSSETIAALNENGYYVTVLSTTGGFLKQKNVTLLIGTYKEEQDKVYSILQKKAGRREEPDYHAAMCAFPSEGSMQFPQPFSDISPPIMRTVGGVTTFVIRLEGRDKF